MNLTDIVELYIIAGDQLDASWEFFVTVHLAILAALYGIDKLHKLKWYEYFILGVGYLAFSFINIRAKIEAYACLISITKDAKNNLNESSLDALNIFFQNIQFYDRVAIAWTVHIVAFITVIVLTIIRHDDI